MKPVCCRLKNNIYQQHHNYCYCKFIWSFGFLFKRFVILYYMIVVATTKLPQVYNTNIN